MPISTIDGEIVSLSFGGPGTLPVSANLSVLSFAAHYVLGRHLQRIAAWQRFNSNLKQSEAAREKLGAVSKAHAIATAIRAKLLR